MQALFLQHCRLLNKAAGARVQCLEASAVLEEVNKKRDSWQHTKAGIERFPTMEGWRGRPLVPVLVWLFLCAL